MFLPMRKKMSKALEENTEQAAVTETRVAETVEAEEAISPETPDAGTPDSDLSFSDEGKKTPEPSKQKKEKMIYTALDWIKTLTIVILLSLLLTNFVIQRNTVKGRSMFPTLKNGDELFVEKVSRYFGALNRGDIITVDTHGLDLQDPNRVIKRIVGMPGEHVEIRDGKVYIDGQALYEPYLQEGTVTEVRNASYQDVQLADNEYFCLGDNRSGSKDSRTFGPVPADHVLGKLLLRFYPFDRFGKP